MIKEAIKKIDKELKEFKGDQKAKAVSAYVAKILKKFSEQEEEFAQAIAQTDKTLSDCCKEIMKSVGNSISDIEVYKKAVSFYFPGAGINFTMTIDLCASVNRNITVSQSSAAPEVETQSERVSKPQKKSILNISLDDLFFD